MGLSMMTFSFVTSVLDQSLSLISSNECVNKIGTVAFTCTVLFLFQIEIVQYFGVTMASMIIMMMVT